MARIISIADDVVSIGQDDGSLTEVRLSDCNFAPRIGDSVEVFKSDEAIKVVLAQEKPASHMGAQSSSGDGVHINISNDTVNAPAQPMAYPQGKVVNKIGYILLALFLGGLGVHKFYAGKVGMGILYLVFCWTGIPVLLSLIDLIIAATKSSDANGNIVI